MWCWKLKQEKFIGIKIIMNLSSLLFVFLLYLTTLGNYGIHPGFANWQGFCDECGAMVKVPKGIFCGNFAHPRGVWPACRKAWCGRCYKADPTLTFQIAKPENDRGNVWQKKEDEERFLIGRNGDSLCQPFQCDLCWFRNLKRRDPIPNRGLDVMLLIHIRRVNLDMLWSREKGTVATLMTNYRKSVAADRELGLDSIFPQQGPWMIEDNQGFQVALRMIVVSRYRGSHSSEYQQFDTIRKLRTLYSHLYESSGEAEPRRVTMRSERGTEFRTSDCPTQSLFFTRFMTGLLSRMGKDVRTDRALDVWILKVILNNLESEVLSSSDLVRNRDLLMVGFYLIICFTCSLRGNEGFMMDLNGLLDHIYDGSREDDKDHPHIVVTLLGRFKNEWGERWHIMLAASETASGLKPRRWLGMFLLMMLSEGKTEGPAICEPDGQVMSSGKMNRLFWRELTRVQEQRPDLIKPQEDVEDIYNIRRSLRRGSQTTAREAGVSGPDIDLINRWRGVEATGGRASGAMRDYYTEIRLMHKRLLVYSKSL